MALALPQLSEAQLLELVQEIFERAYRLYPNDPRMIARASVQDMGGGDYHVMVASLDL